MLEMIKVMEESVGEWGVRGRRAWIGLALSYQLLLRPSELFTGEGGGRTPTLLLEEGGDSLIREFV